MLERMMIKKNAVAARSLEFLSEPLGLEMRYT